ncbi:MFS transporter [Clostridium sp. D2Q-11]|uniref:MFS transporter n=1 Tax=Anaeromonas frigoriresistens TaxID=2683708 RepID=A0A942UUJ1_9FIRM|nr:MFS transporter [Anaeromonas frigoriresistens]MBS4537034.1 MFS transporter [Anaeromonas frigoriresistens]
MDKLRGYIQPYKGLPVSIYVIFFAAIVNNMGNFVGPFLTMFLTYRVGINVGMVGIIVACNAGLGMLGAMIGGKLIDQIGRKKILIIFRTLAGIGYGTCAFVESPLIITSILMFSSFFGGFSQPVYGTIITDITDGEERKSAFSLHYMAINIGYSVGPLLAGFLYKNYLMWLFLGDALTTFLSIALVAIFVPETLPDKDEIMESQSKTYEKAEEGNLLSILIKRPTLLMFSFIIVIYFIVFSQFNFGLSLQIGDVFGDNGATLFGVLMTVNAVMCSIFTVVVNSATKDFKSSFNIAVGGILYMIGFGMIAFINSFWLFVVSTIIWTIGEILVATNTSVYIANHTPITHRGRFNAVFPIIRKLGFIIGPMMAGAYVKYSGIKSLWILIGALSLVGSIMMYRLYIMDIRKEDVKVI